MSDKPNKTYVFIFTTLMCLISGLLLTASSTVLKERQNRNIEIDKQKNVLKSVGLVKQKDVYMDREIENLFKTNISEYFVGPSGEILESNEKANDLLKLYIYKKNGKINSYIIPVETRGLWGKIKGYLALKNDGSTIVGFSVYSHSETPGLGGEIEQNWFTRNFVGKKIVDGRNKFVSIGIAKGSVSDSVSDKMKDNYVDGISGATLTGSFLTKGLESILARYEKVSVRFRQEHLKNSPKK
jgi:Na+-transporting NADH:ubiquinone oxidoreductase subunit C